MFDCMQNVGVWNESEMIFKFIWNDLAMNKQDIETS